MNTKEFFKLPERIIKIIDSGGFKGKDVTSAWRRKIFHVVSVSVWQNMSKSFFEVRIGNTYLPFDLLFRILISIG